MSVMAVLFICLFALLVFSVPITYALGLSSVFVMAYKDIGTLLLLPQKAVAGMSSFVLIAIPMFTLAGYLMDVGGISKRLVKWAETVFYWVPGSTGAITTICCMIFAALTGSGPATVAAIGGIMMPSMLKSGYKEGQAASLVVAGGCLGPIIPPSIPMVIYGASMGVSISAMFAGAAIPGIILGSSYLIINAIIAKRNGIKSDVKKVSPIEMLKITWNSLGVLFLPVIVLGGIYGGIFTPTEASAVAVVYALILGIVFREISWKSLLVALKKTAMSATAIMMIIAISALFGWILSMTRAPQVLAKALIPYINSKATYMVLLMVLLFFIGCLMDMNPAILVLAPIVVPLGYELGIDPVHLGVVYCTNLVVGMMTPPFGMNIFTATAALRVKYQTIVKHLWPYILVSIILVFFFALCEDVVMFLPNLIAK